jgi:hypothetical protein
MDLRITIIDENSEILEQVVIYQDGSDSEGAAKIVSFLRQSFMTQCDECRESYDDADGPTCQTCLDWEVTDDT